MHKFTKLLAVAVVLALAVSMLCVSSFATASTPSTVTINGTTYDVVYYTSGSYSSGEIVDSESHWASYNFDLDLIDALNTENAVFAIVRSADVSTLSPTTATDDPFEKFGLVGSWWCVGTPIYLGTSISTYETEGSSTTYFLDCTYDDGINVLYDASAIYKIWYEGGYYADLNSSSDHYSWGERPQFISNTNLSYYITTIMVLVPQDTSSYKVTVASADGGTVTADATSGFTGDGTETVTLTVSSSSSSSVAYRISALTVTDENGATVALTNNHDGTYTFTMPASNVTVTPTFESSDLRYLYVNGVNVQNIVDYTVICGEGTATFDYDSNTLTLNNATIECSYTTSSSMYYGIHATYYAKTVPESGLTVKLVGTNTLVSDTTGNAKYNYGLYTQYTNLNITSEDSGVLTADALYYGIQAASGYTVSISDCTVSLTNITFYALSAPKGLDISNSTVTLSAVSDGSAVRGINSSYPITITDSTVSVSASATTKASYAIYTSYNATSTSDSALIVENSTLICTNDNSSYPAIYAGSITASGSSTVIADGGVNLLSTKTYTHVALSPETGYEMSILVGASETDAKESVTTTEDKTITLTSDPTTSEFEYGTYAYFAITSTGLTYDITVSETENGTVEADETSTTGSTVTITVTADDNYEVSEVTVTDANGNTVAVTDNGDGTYSFTMPASEVTISATFAKKASSGTSGISGLIYVNEQYHGYFVNGHLVCVEHTVNSAGYCTVCHEYIGLATDEVEVDETETTEEVVEVEEPVEDTDVDDEEGDELPVEDDEPAAETESNPTTGVALALLPMAVAGVAAAISKRR